MKVMCGPGKVLGGLEAAAPLCEGVKVMCSPGKVHLTSRYANGPEVH